MGTVDFNNNVLRWSYMKHFAQSLQTHSPLEKQQRQRDSVFKAFYVQRYMNAGTCDCGFCILMEVVELAFSLVLGEAYTPSIYRLDCRLNFAEVQGFCVLGWFCLEKSVSYCEGELVRALVYWCFGVVPFEDFQYCFVRVAYLLQDGF